MTTDITYVLDIFNHFLIVSSLICERINNDTRNKIIENNGDQNEKHVNISFHQKISCPLIRSFIIRLRNDCIGNTTTISNTVIDRVQETLEHVRAHSFSIASSANIHIIVDNIKEIKGDNRLRVYNE